MYLNCTDEYHRNELETLGWELTVCNSLADEKSSCRRALKNPVSFGEALYRFLETLLPMKGIVRVIEVGGGHGNLMADFVRLNPELKPAMIDISPALLALQREALQGRDVEFVHGDFYDFPDEKLISYELAIFNENLGDFPAVCDITASDIAHGATRGNRIIEEIARDFAKYNFPVPDLPYFNYNIGAVRVIERLCAAGIPYIYVSEHSCEARLPDELAGFLNVCADGNPRAIRLYGHVEYTVRFSHLETVARHYGYAVRRGCFADFLPVKWTDELHFIVHSKSAKEEHEIIRQFIEDLYTYEYLVLT